MAKITNIKICSIVIFIMYSLNLCAQLNLRGGGKLIINGGTSISNIFIVLNSPPAIPISVSGNSDGIIMEDEFNRLQYNLGTASTAITIPFMSSALEAFPLNCTPTSVGLGGGNIRFSTKKAAIRATGWDNSTYLPSDVTNMNGVTGVVNNSALTIDRFWIIDANGYTTKPSVTLDFTYIDAELAANGGNVIFEGNLRAQRFNNSNNSWEGMGAFPPTGTINITNNTVTSVAVTSGNFFKSWSINDLSIPLPMELLKFEANCLASEVVLSWTTVSETNNDFFSIEYSVDGVNWITIASILGAGNSSQMMNYSFIDSRPLKSEIIVYYRLKQTDYDGQFTYSNSVSTNCNVIEDDIKVYNNQHGEIAVDFASSITETYRMCLYDAQGKKIGNTQFDIEEGRSNFKINISHLSTGIYLIVLDNNKKTISKKIAVMN